MKAHFRLINQISAAGLIFTLATIPLSCKTEQLDPRELANALAEEYDEWLEFENSTTEPAPPPTENIVDPNIPQITRVTAPLILVDPADENPLVTFDQVYGEWFNIVIQFNGDPTLLQSVLAHVRQANTDNQAPQYFMIGPTVDATMFTATITARVSRTARLPGNSFNVVLALQDTNGEVSSYASWNVITLPPSAAPNTVVPQCACDPLAPGVAFVTPGLCTDSSGVDNFTIDPCYFWTDAFHGQVDTIEDTSAVEFPSGTWFEPTGSVLSDPAAATDCMVELRCGGGGSDPGPDIDPCPGCNPADRLLKTIEWQGTREPIYTGGPVPPPGPPKTRSPSDNIPSFSYMNPVLPTGGSVDIMFYLPMVDDPTDVFTGAFLSARTVDDLSFDFSGFHVELYFDMPMPVTDGGYIMGTLNAPQLAGRAFELEIAVQTNRQILPAGCTYLVTEADQNSKACECSNSNLMDMSITSMPLSDPCSHFLGILGIFASGGPVMIPHGTRVESTSTDPHTGMTDIYSFQLICP